MKQKLKQIILILSIVLIGFTCKKPEPEITGTINGTITDKTTVEPVKGVIVTIVETGTPAATGADGIFKFENLEPKTYTLQCEKDGYTTLTKTVNVSVGVNNFDIQMEEFKPFITILPTNLDFGSTETTKSVQISNTGSGTTLAWTSSCGDAWISYTPNSGSIEGTNSVAVQVTVNRTNLNSGTYTGSIIFNASNSNSVNLPVTMTIQVPGAPSVTSGSALNITQTAASINGQILSIGSDNVSQYGHCWSTNSLPTILDAKTTLGSTSSPVNYTSTLTGLTANTTYYARAYATNSVGTAYSSEITFTTSNVPTVPAVTTGTASEISTTTAIVSGEVIDLGTSNVTQHGHCWSTSPNPTTGSAKTSLGSLSVPATFNSTLTSLQLNTTYYVKAYATNSVGTAYGSEITITTTSPTLPSVSTGTNPTVTYNSATIIGTINSTGNGTITQHGHCWSTSPNPTTSNNKTQLGSTTNTGNFTSNITGLSAETTYYIKAYATNSLGTAYGDELIITTPVTPILVTSGLVAYYRFDDQNSNDWNGNYNGVASNCSFSTDIPNNNGYSITLDGTSSYINLPNNPINGASIGSFSYWIKSTDQTSTLFEIPAGSCCDFHLSISSGKVTYGNGASFSTDISSLLLDNNWHLLTATFDGSASKLFIDAILIDQKTGGAMNWTSNLSAWIGKEYYGYYYSGKFDNIRIYSRAISQSEITEIYNAEQ